MKYKDLINFPFLLFFLFNSCDKNEPIAYSIDINIGLDTTIVYGDTLILDAGAGFDSYLWNDGLSNKQTLSVTNNGAYWVMAIKNDIVYSDTINVDTILSCFSYCDTTVSFFDSYNLKIPCSYTYIDETGIDSRSVDIWSKSDDVQIGKERDILFQYDTLKQLTGSYDVFSNRMIIIDRYNKEVGVLFFKMYPEYVRDVSGLFFVKENTYYLNLMGVSYTSNKKSEIIEILRSLKLH